MPQLIQPNRPTMRSAAFSRDSETLATAGDDGLVRLWDVARDSSIGDPLKAGAEKLVRVVFSVDDALVSASDDATIRL